MMTVEPANNTRRRRPLRAAMAAAVLISLPSHPTALLSTTPTNSAVRRSALTMKVSSSSSSGKKLVSKQPEKGYDFIPASRKSSTTSLQEGAGLDDRHEFEMNLGRAVDTLKKDYPDLLTQGPDYSIYHPDLEIIDPAGVKLHGLSNYKNAFRLVHTIVNLFYCPERSLLTFRLVYDWARNDIRVSWNAEVVPKAIFGGTRTTLHVDGISVYKVNPADGKIVQHRIEHLVINDNLIAPERGIIHALQTQADSPDCSIPVFNTGSENHIVQFQSSNPFHSLLFHGGKSMSLFSSPSAMAGSNSDDASQYPELDWDAYEQKNKSRKKFGLKPLTPEEFVELQAQVQQMEVQRRQEAAAAAAESSATKGGEPNVFEKLLGSVLEDTCESNFDCQRPEVCCDFGFKKMCCSSGVFVGRQDRFGEKATVPVVDGTYPPGMGPQDDPRTYYRY